LVEFGSLEGISNSWKSIGTAEIVGPAISAAAAKAINPIERWNIEV
jgi:hypothetical protein